MPHIPVLLNEVIEILNPKPGEFFIDGTLGSGGHAKRILKEISPGGKFLGVDWDKRAIEEFKSSVAGYKSSVILINDNYKNISMILKQKNLGKADGVILDLGLSSEQLESGKGQPGRGFSFLRDEPLLMTYSEKTKPVYQWLSELNEVALEKIIRTFGEERFAGRIARAIKKNLPIVTSKKLAEVVAGAVSSQRGLYEHGRIHPATRVFQALRIFANQELENLKIFLERAGDILNPGGRLAIISFHSLEDRIIKNSFREMAKKGIAELLTKKPITPSKVEIMKNPRSRSAKLRALVIRN